MNVAQHLPLRFRNPAPVTPASDGRRDAENNRIEIGADCDSYFCSPSYMDEQRAKERANFCVGLLFVLVAALAGFAIWKAAHP